MAELATLVFILILALVAPLIGAGWVAWLLVVIAICFVLGERLSHHRDSR